MVHSLDYVYDATTKELKEIVSPAGTFAFAPDAWGRRGSLTYPNGVVASYAYNAQTDWLTAIDYKNGAAGPSLLDIAYPEHDKVGNRKARVEDNVTTSYGYDVTYQLRSATTGPSVEAFDYDAVGNRESGPTVKDLSYTHDAGNRMLEGRQFDYSYDEFGNQQFRYLDAAHTKFWQYSWDGENRLIEARLEKAGATLRTVSFTYDPFGRRIEKRVVEGTTATTYGYFYDAEDIVLESKAVQVGGGAPVVTSTQLVHGPGIDEPLAMIRGGQNYFYHADGLGSIVVITDAEKNIVQRYKYDSFGMATPSNPEFENSYMFTGREWDKEVGLYYYRARYYDPMEGRFISKDPIGFAGGDVNLYGYVGNQPIDFIDPIGWDRTRAEMDRHERVMDEWEKAKTKYASLKNPETIPYAGGYAKKGVAADCSGSLYATAKEAGLSTPYFQTSDLNKIGNDAKVDQYFTERNGPPQRGDYIVYKDHMIYFVGMSDEGKYIVYGAHYTKGPDFNKYTESNISKATHIITPK